MALAFCDIWYRHDRARGLALLDAAVARYPLGSLPPLDRNYATLAYVYALGGRPARARELLADVRANERVPGTTRGGLGLRDEGTYLRALGATEIAEGKPAQAVVTLRQSVNLYFCPTCTLPDLARARARGQSGLGDRGLSAIRDDTVVGVAERARRVSRDVVSATRRAQRGARRHREGARRLRSGGDALGRCGRRAPACGGGREDASHGAARKQKDRGTLSCARSRHGGQHRARHAPACELIVMSISSSRSTVLERRFEPPSASATLQPTDRERQCDQTGEPPTTPRTESSRQAHQHRDLGRSGTARGPLPVRGWLQARGADRGHDDRCRSPTLSALLCGRGLGRARTDPSRAAPHSPLSHADRGGRPRDRHEWCDGDLDERRQDRARVMPLVVGLLAGLVLYARSRVVPIREKARGSERQVARSAATFARRTA